MTNETAGLRTVLVTGGSRGIGAATAWKCAQEGWAVAVNYARDRDAAERIVDRILATGGQARALQADVADEAQVLKMFAAIDAEMAPLGALVNNAGVIDVPGRVDTMTRAAPRAHVRDQRDRLVRLRARGGASGCRRSTADAAARSSTCRRPRRGSVRPASTSTTPPRRARSTSSRSASRRKWRPKAFASTQSGPASSRPTSMPRADSPIGRARWRRSCRCSAPAAPKRSPRRSSGCSPTRRATRPAP